MHSLLKALKDFLKENSVPKEEEHIIINRFFASMPHLAIDSFGWHTTEYSYYFWYFLQLKWIRFLLHNREIFNLQVKNLVLYLKEAVSYSELYKTNEGLKTKGIGKEDYYRLKGKYNHLTQKYEDLLKIIQE